jgi:HNH endonuclease
MNYRDQALKLFPHICARCAREFQGKRLQELTVHHKDMNHDNNPPDGSNWELLCIYCHENEHARYEDSKAGNSGSEPKTSGRAAHQSRGADPVATHRPLAALDALLKKKRPG